jgi:hypothetical protein
MTQPDPNAPSSGSWSWAVQRELDGLQRSIDQRLSDMTNQITKLVSITEYLADKRGLDLELRGLREKIVDVEKDLETFKADVRRALDEFRRDNSLDHARLERAIAEEVSARHTERITESNSRRSTLRWVIGIVIIPVVMIVVTIWTSKH